MVAAVETSEIIRNYAIVLGGFTGLALALWRGWSLNHQARAQALQARIATREHVAVLFRNLAADLKDEDSRVRIAAVEGLVAIANDYSTDYHQKVSSVLSEHHGRSVFEQDPADTEYTLVADFIGKSISLRANQRRQQ